MTVLRVTKADFEERHQLFLILLDELEKYNIAEVAKLACVSEPTLYNWLSGNVIAPSTRTLFAVANALGFELQWRQVRSAAKPKRRLYVVK